ncbi:porin [Piscinibacter gummiphilus]|uniref:Porin n=1 Tax=Piscinibacter gummiphilus TaxID=946333 RepID=A0ABZ0D220_9BURK|nr:porin [Piscinibacter gummiphilus]WOB09282.1 porin [Piscinibacter gummiphilus]
MKKSLLALALLGAYAAGAYAQSSVTIYGIIDESVAKGNGGTAGSGGVAALGTSKAWQVRDGGPGSRLGFRGNEDLGGGLSAQFLIEHRFSPDTGNTNPGTQPAASNTFWFGGSYVQLTSSMVGSVYLGRWYSPAFWVSLKTDPFGYGGIAQVGALTFANYTNPSAVGLGARTTNTVGYKTPNWGGLTANVAVGLGEGGTAGRDTGVNIEFTSGPIYAGLAYDKINSGTPTFSATSGAVDGNSLIVAGFAYNFGFIRPMISYATSETRTGSVVDTDALSFGLTAPAGPGLIKAQYTMRNTDAAPLAGVPVDVKLKKLGIGYDYFLSKRTKVYADYTAIRETNLTNHSAFALGVRHDF